MDGMPDTLDGNELAKLRQLLDNLEHNHFPSYEETQALRMLISSDELKTLLEREKTYRLWAKVRLQMYRVVGAILATLAAAGATWTFVEALYKKAIGQ